MKENIEKSLRRWLKRKVKITLGLTVSFMITGTVGFASVEGSLTPNENGDINYKLTTENEEYILNTKSKDKILEANGSINLKLDANYNSDDKRRSVGGIATTRATTNLIAQKNIVLDIKNTGNTKTEGIGKQSSGKNGITNLVSKEGNIGIKIDAYTKGSGIITHNYSEKVNLTAETGNISIDVKTINGKQDEITSGISNIGNINLKGENILVSSTTNKEQSRGVFSSDGGKTVLEGNKKIEITSISKENETTGLDSREFFGSKGQNIITADEVIIKAFSNNDKIPESISDKISNARTVYSHGGKNEIKSGKKGIVLVAEGRDLAEGIYGKASGENILKSEAGNIIINSKSKEGTSRGIFSDTSKTEIDSGAGIEIISNGKKDTYGVMSQNKSTVDLKGKEDIKIFSESMEGQSSGIYAFLSDIKLESENNMLITSKGKTISYGVCSFDNNSAQKQANLVMSSLGDMTISSEAIDGTSYGTYLEGKSSILGKGVTNIFSKSENGVSTGISSKGKTLISSGKGITISSKSVNESSQGINNTGKLTLNSEKNIDVISTGKKGDTYGVLSWQNADLMMSSLSNMTISSEAIDGTSYGTYLQGIANINSKEGNIFISSKGEKTSYGVLNKQSTSNIEGKERIQISSESGEKSYGILSQLKNKLDIKGKEIVVDSNGKKETYGIVLTKNGIENKDNNSLNVSGNLGINAKSSGKEAYGILTRDSILEVNGNTNIVVEGREINQKRAEEMTEEQEQFAKDILEKGNNTIGKIFTTYEDEKVYTGAVNQGIRANNSLVNFNGNLNVSSTDIAMTSIGKNSNITVNGDSTFVGNKYTLDLGKDTPRLIAKPVIQALDGGKITLNGNTGVGSIVNQNHEPHIANVGLYAHGYTDVENTDLRSTIEIFGEANISSDVATMATKGGNIYINQYDGKEKASMSDVNIAGDIVAGRDSEVKISGKDVNIAGDILAGNGGKVTIDLTSENSNFVGRIDDYFDIEEKFGNDTFRDDKYKMDISTGGVVTINMDNNAKWDVKEQSYITNLNFGANGGQVILDEPNGTNSTLSIETISGAGIFSLNLNADEKEKGAMLYIYNASEENLKHTVKLDISKIEDFEVGEEIRFATLGKDAKDKNMSFKVEDIKEEGIKDISFDTGHESYDSQDKENEIYNGDETTEDKPGEELIEENYKEGENWFLSRKAESSKVNDIGQTIIEMSKSNYASAIYMDNLNKRLGDMTFAEGNEGYWVRVRNDRVGEDEEYRLRNNMTQLGYDKSYSMEEGKGTEYRGLAFEYSKGDMEYKNIIGSADVDRLALWAYDTKMYNDGFYSDYVFRFGRMSSEFDIKGRETGNNATGDYDNLFAGVSAEFGKRYDISEKAYFEPQIQLQYTYIDDVDYTTNQNTKVEYSDINSLIGRAGFRLGYDYYKENSKDNTIYLKADANHEFLGEQNIKAIDLTGELNERYHNNDTWYDVGIGTAKDLTEDLHIYADVERQFGHKDNSWQFNLGFRWKF